jgi:hypothetical protein
VDIARDPFGERPGRLPRHARSLLGAKFRFESDSPELMRLIEWAYDGLPEHRLSGLEQPLLVRLALSGAGQPGREDEPPPFSMSSAPGVLWAASPSSSIATVSPAARTALVIVARDLLAFPYHVRYELIEMAVFTLAARVQGLLPLHAACIAHHRRGLLLVGASGAGKSTAVLHAALAGVEVVSEDSLFVAPDTLLATGVANFLHVREEALRFLSAADAALVRRAGMIRRRSGVPKFEVDLRQRRFRLARRPPQLAAVIELSAREATGASLLAPREPRQVLRRLEALQPYAASQPGWRPFSQRLLRLPAFELRRGRHPRDGVDALRALLRDGGACRA